MGVVVADAGANLNDIVTVSMPTAGQVFRSGTAPLVSPLLYSETWQLLSSPESLNNLFEDGVNLELKWLEEIPGRRASGQAAGCNVLQIAAAPTTATVEALDDYFAWLADEVVEPRED
jgi:hypothetical protein